MQKYKYFQPTGFDGKGSFLNDRQEWLVLPVSRTRDTGYMSESNFETALEMLGGESDTVEVHRFGHWGPGWFEIIIVDPESDTQANTAKEIESSLADYPILDDSDYSEREVEAQEEAWDNYARGDFMSALEKSFSEFLEDNEDLLQWYHGFMFCIHDIDEDRIDTFYHEQSDIAGSYPETESDESIYYRFDFVEDITLEDFKTFLRFDKLPLDLYEKYNGGRIGDSIEEAIHQVEVHVNASDRNLKLDILKGILNKDRSALLNTLLA